MTDQIEYDDLVNMLYGMVEIIEREHQRLSQLDSISGDGDHGTTMARAMKLVSKAIAQQENKDIKSLLESVSWNLLGVDGGATGPLLGTLFKGMADSLEEGQPLTVAVFSQMFETGLVLIEKITKARPGDKTMMDALVPAIISLKESAQKGENFVGSLKAAATASGNGAEYTKDLVARFGRAKNLGEKTLGHPDPGATSMAFIFKGFYEGLLKRRENMANPIPKTMSALVLTKPGAFEIQQAPVPEPGPYEVLCKVQAVAICGSDPRIVDGTWAGMWPPSYPFIPGHEWAGEIVAVGENASSYRPGDRVAGEAHTGCGYCRYCLRGQYNLCENYGKPETGHRHYGFVSSGAYAQYGVFSIRSIRRIPSGVSFQEATMVDTAGVALHGIDLAGITPGGTVAVIGAGPIGIITMRLARILGAGKIIALDTGDRVAAAVRLAADVAFDFAKEDPVKTVLAATNGLGADEVCECSGAPETFAQSVRMVRKGGRVSLIGIPPDPIVTDLPFNRIVLSEIAIFGSRANPNVTDKVLALISSGRLVVKDLITHIFPLKDFGQGVDIFGKHRDGVIKVVIEPNEPEKL